MSNKIKTDYFSEFNNDGEELETTSASDAKEDFASMLGESLKAAPKKLKVGDKIRGKILVIGQEDVFVSTGTQHDGIISRRELLDAEGNLPYQRDDSIELFVTQVKGGEIRLSKSVTDRTQAADLQEAFAQSRPIQGRIAEVCKGGVRVNIKGKLAFCPISQLDSKHVENAEDYIGKSFDFRITQLTEGGRNIVVSRRKLLDEEREVGTTSFLSENLDGAIVPARITRFEKFGAFAELSPGVEGLIHISEIAWSRIGDPSEVLQIGQTVNVKILKRELVAGRAKISLSVKQATPREETAPSASTPKDDPWQKFSVGQVFAGKVNRKELYGLFVQIEPGVTGLLHKSQTLEHPEFHFEKIRVGDTVSVQIGEIRLGERQISLTLPKDPDADSWREHRAETTSFGTLGDQLKSALTKKKP
jgi:small subunit ribosomal protein S1